MFEDSRIFHENQLFRESYVNISHFSRYIHENEHFREFSVHQESKQSELNAAGIENDL
jgi:hypothetical protein